MSQGVWKDQALGDEQISLEVYVYRMKAGQNVMWVQQEGYAEHSSAVPWQKEKQIVQNKERRVETAAEDCRVQGSLFLFRQRWRQHFDHQGVGHSHAILDQNPTEAQL